MHLSAHGSSQDGVLGALAATGLHLSGNDGLFITLPGIDDLPYRATLETVYGLAPIDLVRDDAHRRPGPGELIELGDWVRPVLFDGRAVLLLEPPRGQAYGARTWRTAPRAVVKRY